MEYRESVQEGKHVPVMVKEMLEALQVVRGGKYADVTYGCGGYSSAIEAASGERVWASDRDPEAVKRGEADPKVAMHHAKFSQLDQFLTPHSLEGLVADLGLSSTQLANPERGFSFMSDGPLDMRMGLCQESASELIARSSVQELANLLWEYGEERRSRSIARLLKELKNPSTGKVARIALSRTLYASSRRRHPATRTFQALRIAVNDELEELRCLVKQASKWLKRGGRLVIVTFHSLEDRIVKHALKEWPSRARVFPSRAEILANPRARSAKLRWGGLDLP